MKDTCFFLFPFPLHIIFSSSYNFSLELIEFKSNLIFFKFTYAFKSFEFSFFILFGDLPFVFYCLFESNCISFSFPLQHKHFILL